MTRIHQQSGSTQQLGCFEFGASFVQAATYTIALFATLVLLTAISLAQSTSQLNGSVTDPSGATVPGAKIVLTDTATGLQRTTTSNSAGLYQFLEVPPGNYKLEAQASGFTAYVAAKVTLVVSTPSTLNIKFRVAGIEETVTVEGQAPLINRTDASLGNTVEENQIAELPIPDRNVVQLLSLQPGVAFLGNQLNEDTDTRSGAVNGMRSDQSNVTLDGVGVNDQNGGYAFKSVLNVPPDSVQEFRVTTANSTAESGYSSGAQVALVTKTGTNNFHGSVYEYNRNTIFSANDPFLKESQLGSGEANKAPKLLRNVFGATLGGPVMKNRLFFFANYEGRRDAQGTSVLRTVPSATLRAGDLVYLCADATQCPGGTVNGVSGVQPGYYALGPSQIKAMDPLGIGISPAVQAILQQYPASNENAGDGSNTLGYRFASNADSSFNTYITRLDYHITSNGSETLFARGETQNFKEPGAQQFPGQSAASTVLDDSKGITIGLTSLINPRLINDFHWGFIRQGGQTAGTSFDPAVLLDGIDSIVPFTRSKIFFVPIHQFTDNVNWTRKNHTFEFGGDFFLIRNNHTSYENSFSDVRTNAVYLNTGGIAGTSSPLDPGNNGYPAVDSNFGPNYDSAATIAMGIFPEGDGIYNFARSGSALAQGTPINRRYAVNDYEFYGQDTWRMTSRLTVTYGLRWVLEAPPYETNGYQVAPCVEATGGGCTNQNVADWFNHSAALAAAGQPANNAGEISFVLGGPKNNGPGLWNWDHKDFSPRIAVAWAPDTGDGWVSKVLGKKDQFSIRGGYSIMYDHFGIPIVNTFDQKGSFGLSTVLGNPAGVVSPANAPRFTCLTPGTAGTSCLPQPCASINDPGCLFGPAPTGGFPYTPGNTTFAINWGLDQTLKTPYSHVFNLSLARQFNARSSLQIAYVGTIARRLPMQVDLAMPINLTDPTSKTKYFDAATMLSKAAAVKQANGTLGTDVNQIQPIPFFENMFPGWAGMPESNLSSQSIECAPGAYPSNPSATQAIYELWSCYPHNETFSLFQMDLPGAITQLSVPNSKLGPYAFFHDQFSSLYAWRNIGTSDYNALQVTYNARWSNLQGQFNYTFSKSFDEASAAERVGPYEGTGGTGSDLNGGGIVINSWNPLSLRGLSDFNAFHQLNANLVYLLPFGKNQRFLGTANPWMNALVGGWHVSGIFRWTSGFPITIDNGFTWATNWNIEGDAMPNGPAPKASNPKNAFVNGVGIGPDIFADPAAAEAAFRPEWPGESGVRNNVIGDGMFNIDTGVSKDFSLGESRRIEFSWQAFNAFNSVRYDVRGAQPSLSYDPSQFGKYLSTLTTPRFMQFALRFAF
ncbi:MAG TPA: carboxypeptidase regulatory-like domain-containing protein [Candidatus Sulfotelmatobacter sp.]|nr:carboxypeptidase regulatory-like domain-containing protein [Candidatus Sulfotelmatobacter sp.]